MQHNLRPHRCSSIVAPLHSSSHHAFGSQRQLWWCWQRRGWRAEAAGAAAVAVHVEQHSKSSPLPQLVDRRQRTKELRERLCDSWLAGGLIYLQGGDLLHRNGTDVFHKFRAPSDFVYLTGVTEPGFSALLDPTTRRFTLVAPQPDADAALWWGGLPSLEQLAEEYGADDVVYAHDLAAHVGSGVETVHVLEGDHPIAQAQLLGTALGRHQQQAAQQLAGLKALEAAQPGLQFSTAFLKNALQRCRALKTPAEVACLAEASRGSAAAHRAIWAACMQQQQQGRQVFEWQLEAAFTGAALHHRMPLGYPCIIGAGCNAAILHYESNSAAVQPTDLVLVDAGAEHECYTADITRTFPAGGKFSTQQRDVYDLVLSMQDHALATLRPGLCWADVQASTRRLMLDGLQQLKLVAPGVSTDALLGAGVDRLFMPHGLGHHLGLDVHDVSEVGPVPQMLEQGHVITVEPGVYFMPTLLTRARADAKQAACINWDAVEGCMDMGGVRIEDNVVVTCDGHVNLTMQAGRLPKQADEVEQAMHAAAEAAAASPGARGAASALHN